MVIIPLENALRLFFPATDATVKLWLSKTHRHGGRSTAPLKRKERKRALALVFLFAGTCSILSGCSNFQRQVFAHQVLNAQGQPIFLDDIDAIVNDPDLTDEEKRTQLRDLGLEDEELIEALLIS